MEQYYIPFKEIEDHEIEQIVLEKMLRMNDIPVDFAFGFSIKKIERKWINKIQVRSQGCCDWEGIQSIYTTEYYNEPVQKVKFFDIDGRPHDKNGVDAINEYGRKTIANSRDVVKRIPWQAQTITEYKKKSRTVCVGARNVNGSEQGSISMTFIDPSSFDNIEWINNFHSTGEVKYITNTDMSVANFNPVNYRTIEQKKAEVIEKLETRINSVIKKGVPKNTNYSIYPLRSSEEIIVTYLPILDVKFKYYDAVYSCFLCGWDLSKSSLKDLPKQELPFDEEYMKAKQSLLQAEKELEMYKMEYNEEYEKLKIISDRQQKLYSQDKKINVFDIIQVFLSKFASAFAKLILVLAVVLVFVLIEHKWIFVLLAVIIIYGLISNDRSRKELRSNVDVINQLNRDLLQKEKNIKDAQKKIIESKNNNRQFEISYYTKKNQLKNQILIIVQDEKLSEKEKEAKIIQLKEENPELFKGITK